MCGIFGVRGVQDAGALVHLGLYSLQHRGQESAGIVAVDDDGQARAVRSMGLVSEGLGATETAALNGMLAIGHTRYSTAGSSTIENAQPILARFRDGNISLAHNGNIVNATELRRELEDQGAIFSGSMDSEILVHRIARSRCERPEDKLAEALRGVEGAYCLAVTIGDTLLAARDPHGWRPLSLGTLGDGYVFASETCALDIVGATHLRDVEPGEIVIIDNEGLRSMKIPERVDLKRCVFEYVYFARPDSASSMADRSITRAASSGGSSAASAPLRRRISCSASRTPRTPRRSDSPRRPSFRSSSRSFGITTSDAPSFSRARRGAVQKVKVKYNPVREVLDGKSVVMVDDSIVRGTTTRGLVALVRQAGAREVHMRISSPPVTGPCYYGIDTPSREELIGANMTIKQIADHIGVDSLGYLSRDGMLKSVPGGPHGFCHACFSGDYPTPPPTDPDKLRFGCGC